MTVQFVCIVNFLGGIAHMVLKVSSLSLFHLFAQLLYIFFFLHIVVTYNKSMYK